MLYIGVNTWTGEVTERTWNTLGSADARRHLFGENRTHRQVGNPFRFIPATQVEAFIRASEAKLRRRHAFLTTHLFHDYNPRAGEEYRRIFGGLLFAVFDVHREYNELSRVLHEDNHFDRE